MTPYKRLVTQALIVCFLVFSLPLQAVQAGLIGTDQLVSGGAQAERERVARWLEREDVRAALQAQGVSAREAQARVQAMTDAEVQTLAGRLDEAPAGAGVVGALVTVFVILLITDILGFTDVFPFTRPIDR